MQAIGVYDSSDPEAHAHTRGIVLRAIDKLDRLGEDGVRALLGAGRKDESGDYTKGAELAPEQADIIMGFVSARRNTGAATCARLRELVGPPHRRRRRLQPLLQVAGIDRRRRAYRHRGCPGT